ncbi:MAG TPA: DNA polymerase III subunit delta [Candidatus Blautia pullicola]|jgi:DNA polymerase-3 subunit delta|uniref:DNA polymerase III subunit delta n=1 Tax=Candidatus Blautia pullicola TaxID=2838498 RepID=A0A9D2JSN3_9FIRM|nr:DNA polymerase III subunit delta [Candidatus Blautia pullicola]
MKSLQEDIKNQNFKGVYLFFGEEDYLKQQYKGRMKNALCPEEDTMNFSLFQGKKTEPKAVIDLAETMPFFAERRVIFLEDTGFFKNQCQDLPEYMASLPEYLCMVFVESEVDKRSRMYKAVKKYGRAVEFVRQDSSTLMRWVLGILKREGKKITQRDMELFLERTGTDMGNIENELEKLLSYTMGREVITASDIKEVCTMQITNHIFDMLRAVTEKKQKKALDLYYDLLALKEPPMRILFLLARQFNLILQVKELSGEGYDQSATAKRTGLQPFVVRNYMAYARKYGTQELRDMVQECVELETKVKTGQMTDALSVELLLVKFSS